MEIVRAMPSIPLAMLCLTTLWLVLASTSLSTYVILDLWTQIKSCCEWALRQYSNLDSLQHGYLTWYEVSVGACGYTNKDSDYVCAVSHTIFDAMAQGSNPNDNPICKSSIRVTHDGVSIDVNVVDKCPRCDPSHLDVSPAVFRQFSNLTTGKIQVDWKWNPSPLNETTGTQCWDAWCPNFSTALYFVFFCKVLLFPIS